MPKRSNTSDDDLNRADEHSKVLRSSGQEEQGHPPPSKCRHYCGGCGRDYARLYVARKHIHNGLVIGDQCPWHLDYQRGIEHRPIPEAEWLRSLENGDRPAPDLARSDRPAAARPATPPVPLHMLEDLPLRGFPPIDNGLASGSYRGSSASAAAPESLSLLFSQHPATLVAVGSFHATGHGRLPLVQPEPPAQGLSVNILDAISIGGDSTLLVADEQHEEPSSSVVAAGSEDVPPAEDIDLSLYCSLFD
ncbi:hypothetical protein GLOTRDRAFT_92958 [Gloeophyllum trabeum ATCC 11539]|uniref:Uncharacterized protein n=1 Tax=Gloeophyllum trabeum (strain ATCC 11539 / FP-39264 / Madison 617) TaxID=670483 RepID=S7Q9E3_GLOTA|nr:uncharacterized protein GLOTRDRAFT_92958 [Gloeophyllum trabeum ATCC 11539]EPQ56541.1 hypothetical protein GLOTRDRAFT_92958 [Gloeophyllum trabeum ATCC 11539]